MPDRMGFYDVLRSVAETEGLTLADVGRRAGRSASYVTGNMSRGSLPRVDNAAAMLSACGWALVAVRGDAVPAEALEIVGDDDGLDVERRALERRRDRLRRELAETEELLG